MVGDSEDGPVKIAWLRGGGSRDGARDEDFAAFVAAAYPSLCRTAYLVVGDWLLAEDVVQNALVSVYRKWDRIEHEDGAGDAAPTGTDHGTDHRTHHRTDHPAVAGARGRCRGPSSRSA